MNRTTVVHGGQMVTRSLEHLKAEQRNDPVISTIIDWMEKSDIKPEWKSVSPQNPDVKGYWMVWDSLCLQDGILC